MKHISKTIFTFIFIALPGMILAQGSQEEMQAWMEYMTPGSVHEALAKCDGTWEADITMWMAPDTEPMKTTAVTENKMILGGRYQQGVNTGSMMGMPFEGISMVGYDNKRKVIQSTWIDNMGTGMMVLEGEWDDATNSCILYGKTVDPMTGNMIDVREVFTIVDDKIQKMEMYMTKPGEKEFKTMEILWTKK